MVFSSRLRILWRVSWRIRRTPALGMVGAMLVFGGLGEVLDAGGAQAAIALAPTPAGIPVAQAVSGDDPRLSQADAAYRREDYATAVQLYRQVLGGVSLEDPIWQAFREPFSQSLMMLGEDAAALPYLEAATRQGAAPHEWVRLGMARLRTGDAAGAETAIAEGITRWEQLRSRDRNLTDLERVTLLEQQGYAYRLMQRALIAQNKTEAALAWAERGRARSLVELLVQQAAGETNPVPPSVEQMRAIARSQRSTLVVYSVLGNTDRILGNEIEAETRLAIWTIAPSGAIAFRQLDLSTTNAETVLKPILAVRGAITSPVGLDPSPALRQLHDLLITPIADQLPRDPQARVVLILQGPLYLVPFAALEDATGTPLIQRHALSTAPSVQALDVASRHVQPRRPGSALVIGNPVDMPALPSGPNRRMEPLDPLPGAESEAEAIARRLGVQPLLNRTATLAAVMGQIRTASVLHFATHGILEFDANLNEFGLPRQQDTRTAREGGVFVSPTSVTLSGGSMTLSNGGSMTIGPGGGLIIQGDVTVNDDAAAVALAGERVVQPAVPGMLALAPDAGDDGLLRAKDIAALQLQANLVVLSACDTGRGRITGDGVVGLARSFLAAGASTVVASLWKVPDEATQFLMVKFYEELDRNPDKAIALQAAILATRSRYPAPRNWAAFLSIGALE